MKKILIIAILSLLFIGALIGQISSPMGHNFEHQWSYYSNFNIDSPNEVVLDLGTYEGYDADLSSYVLPSSAPTNLRITWSGVDEPIRPEIYLYRGNIGDDNSDDESDDLVEVWSFDDRIVFNNYFVLQMGILSSGDYTLKYSFLTDAGILKEIGTSVFYVGEANQFHKVNAYGDELFRLSEDIGRQIKQPMLWIEGFDIYGGWGYPRYKKLQGDIERVDSDAFDGMDVYFLNFSDPYRDLRDNAMSVLGALQYIQSQYSSQHCEGVKLMGFSMGGVISRYALSFAEHFQIPHGCSQFISFDSPHLGATMNPALQRFIEEVFNLTESAFTDLPDALIGWLFDIFGSNPFPSDQDLDNLREQIRPFLRSLRTTAAKQLFRNNIHSDNLDYMTGTDDYLDFYREINTEDRDQYYSGTPNPPLVLNDDQSQGSKPGFPYKQNCIKSIAIANGGTQISGDVVPDGTNGDCVYGEHEHLIGVYGGIPSWVLGDVHYRAYDTQPGSVFPLNGTAGEIGDQLTVYYEPVFVPTRSSLYLKPDSVNGNTPYNENLSIQSLSEITSSTGVAMEDYLLEHSCFDVIAYNEAPNIYVPAAGTNEAHIACTGHPRIVPNVVNRVVDSIRDISNRSISTISGIVYGVDLSEVSMTVFLGDNTQSLSPEYYQFNPDGTWKVFNTLLQDTDYRVQFCKPGFFSEVEYHVDYNPSNCSADNVDNQVVFINDYNLQNITVSNQDHGQFDEVNEVVDFLERYYSANEYNGEEIVVKLLSGSGNYGEIDLSPLAAIGITNFTLQGVGEPTIDGDDYGIKLVVGQNSPCNGAVYNINGIKITGSSRGILFKDYWNDSSGSLQAPQLTLNINNCTIHDCGSSSGSFIIDPMFSAAAIHFEGAGLVSYCNIHDNDMAASIVEDSPYCQAGGLFVYNNTSSEAVVTCNIFTNNTGSLSGGIVAKGKGNALISNNQFSGNASSGCCNINNTYQANALSVYDASSINIQNNLFVDNMESTTPYGAVVGLMTYETQEAAPIKFQNNTIINTPLESSNGLKAIIFRINEGTSFQDIQIRNNIISTTNNNGCTIDSGNGFCPISIDHNVIYNTSLSGFSANLYNPNDPASVYNPTSPRFNYQCDPQLDAYYIPIWNASTMSPCIDAGLGEDAEDGTPADIGAKGVVHHQYWEYSFLNQADQEKWYWVSYPVLNSRTNGVLVASEFFKELLPVHENIDGDDEPTYLQQIDWMIGGSNPSISWTNSYWENSTTHIVSSPQGYKIMLRPRIPLLTIRESGFKTSSTTPFPIYGNAENWLGYFLEGPAWPHEAFADIWDDINMIKTKNWCLMRSEYQGDYWGLHGKIGMLNYGDMVVVTTNNTHQNFHWNANNDEIPTEYKATPEQFVYDEKQDYTPVFITIPNDAMMNLKEIGLYLDGVCKGAVVVENELEQICAYLGIDEKLSEGVVDFVFYYDDNKAQHQERKTIRMNADRFSAKYVSGNRRYIYYDIAFSKDDIDNAVTPEVHLNQNYPNPFNPSTTISYSLPEAGQVKLEIYNLRGQLVQILTDSQEPAGDHRKVWNGTDQSGNTVASGVYFYRLRTNNYTISRRMLLMK